MKDKLDKDALEAVTNIVLEEIGSCNYDGVNDYVSINDDWLVNSFGSRRNIQRVYQKPQKK